jgi:uracil-DNA glycosylase
VTVSRLKKLYDQHCTRCELHKNANSVCVPSSGQHTSFKALIVGEAPGRYEDEQNKPFVGRSGWLLDRELFRVNIGRDNIVVTNAVKCRPSGPDGKFNLTPEYPDINTCVDAYLAHEIFLLDARIILALGNVAAQALLDVTGVAMLRESWHALDTKIERWVLVTYHPAYVWRQGLDSVVAQQFREDIKEFSLKIRSEA